MPNSSSFCAMSSLSSTEKETDSPWVPSRRVVSKVKIFRSGAGPAAFDIVDAQLVELLRDEQLVVDGERDGLTLGAVAKSGVKSKDLHFGTASCSSGTPDSFFFLRKVIISRSSRPTFSMG